VVVNGRSLIYFLIIMDIFVQNKRILWVDTLKAMLMIFVMMGHAMSFFDYATPGFQTLNHIFCAIDMPLFMIIAGYFAFHSLDRICSFSDLATHFEKVCRRLAIPSLLYSAIDQLFSGAFLSRRIWIVVIVLSLLYWWMYSKNSKDKKYLIGRKSICFLLGLVSVFCNYFWFLEVLFEFHILIVVFYYFLNVICHRRQLLISCLLLVLFFFFRGEWHFEMSTYYGIGLLACSSKSLAKLIRLNALEVFLLVILIIVTFALSQNYAFYFNSLSDLIHRGLYLVWPSRQLCAVFSSILLFYFFSRFVNSNSIFSKIGKNSMAFYTIHSLIIGYGCNRLCFSEFVSGWSVWICYLLFSFVVAILTSFIILILEKSRVTQLLLLGNN